jgi:PAS domain S-box-containing protein
MMKRKLAYKIILLILIAVITALHYITKTQVGPVHQFYKLLYFIPIILASIQFGFRGGTATSVIISILYSPHKLLSLGPQGDAIPELLDVLLFVAIGIVTGILVEKAKIAKKTMDSQVNRFAILENYTNSVIESIDLGIIAINNDFFITSINAGAKKILGITYDCIGLNFIEVFSCCKDVEEIVNNAYQNNIPELSIERKLQKEINEVHIKIDIFPLSLENKNKGLVIIFDDITEMNKMKLQMHRNDKLASVGQLATGIAHEIRNPLAIIKMIEQTMSKELADHKGLLEELTIIDEEVERANKVIKSLMEFSKPSKQERAQYSIHQIIEDVLTITNKYTSQHKINVSFTKAEVPEGYYDREQIIQAFVNLILNSVDAMPDGGNIYITTQYVADGRVRIEFRDTGLGIEEANLEKIFDPFFTTKDEGTGLGLPIINRIIEDHNGVINVKSSLGNGTSFEIFI